MNLNYFLYTAGFIILIIFLAAPNNNQNQLIGRWFGNLDSSQINIAFLNNNKFKLTLVDKKTLNTNTYEGSYEFDNNKYPAILNLKKISEVSHSLYTNLRFVSSDSIQISLFSKNLKTRLLVLNNDNSFGLKLVSKN